MSAKEYLLTYCKDGNDGFEWFDTEEELRDRIEELQNVAMIIDAVHIISAEDMLVNNNFEY
jgi:hypothetical protein